MFRGSEWLNRLDGEHHHKPPHYVAFIFKGPWGSASMDRQVCHTGKAKVADNITVAGSGCHLSSVLLIKVLNDVVW